MRTGEERGQKRIEEERPRKERRSERGGRDSMVDGVKVT